MKINDIILTEQININNVKHFVTAVTSGVSNPNFNKNDIFRIAKQDYTIQNMVKQFLKDWQYILQDAYRQQNDVTILDKKNLLLGLVSNTIGQENISSAVFSAINDIVKTDSVNNNQTIDAGTQVILSGILPKIPIDWSKF